MKKIIIIVCLCLTSASFADSIFIPFHNNSTHTLQLSQTNINRIDVPGDYIVSARCLSGQCQVSQDASDPNGGRLVELNSMDTKPFTLDVATMSGRHISLYVTPKAMQGRVVILNPLDGGSVKSNTAHNGKSSSYVASLVDVMKAMMQGKLPEGFGAQTVKGRTVTLGGQVTATLKRRFSGQALVGKIYSITNKTGSTITLSPSEFYQPGVRAIALSQQSLGEGDSGYLYVIGDVQ